MREGSQRYRFPVTRRISHGDAVHSMLTTVNSYTAYFKVEKSKYKSSHHQQILLTVYGDEC